MRYFSLVVIAGALCSLSACGPSGSDHAVKWGYDGKAGPENWATLSPDFSACEAGSMQSPIDLALSNSIGEVQVKTEYGPTDVSIVNNGHTVQANFQPGLSIDSIGQSYNLLQVHFHTPSEHVVSGSSSPLAAHFVHASDAGELLVLGVLYDEGAENPELDSVLTAVDVDTGAVSEGLRPLNPRSMIPQDLEIYRYMGSLTTPPCTEGVNWHVATTPMTASKEQIEALKKVMHDNARPIQPMNNRLLIRPQ